MEKFWLVYRLTGNPKAKNRVPRFRHKTVESAEMECDRLANENPGVPFSVLETVFQDDSEAGRDSTGRIVLTFFE